MKYTTNKLNYSSFWADKSIWEESKDETKVEKKSNDLMKLMSYKKSISNFVNIVTGKSIPVTFDGRGDSYTDGKSVVISAKLDDKEFDPVVGLALHEGSHIALTDFKVLNHLLSGILPKSIDTNVLMDKYGKDDVDTLRTHLQYNTEFFTNIKNLLNYVEDRRIDNSIYQSAPGYRGYYESMYDKYFHANIVDKGLKSSEYRTEDWDSYMYRLINITNSNRDLDALNGLKEIWNLLDLRNISRLKSTDDSLELAGEIMMVLEKNIPLPQSDEGSGQGQGTESDDGDDTTNGESPMSGDPDDQSQGGSPMKAEGKGEVSKSDGDSDNGKDGDPTDETAESGSPSTPNKNGAGGIPPSPLNDKQKKMLDNAIEKQKKFMDGDIAKKKVTKADKKKIETLDKADIQSEVTGKGLSQGYYGGYQSNGVQTYVIRNFNKNLVDSDVMEMLTTYSTWTDRNQNNINAGIRLGIQLGKKLKTRNEERILSTPRMKSGKLNGRMLHEIGFGNFDIFDQININTATPSLIHISIDASSSMSGNKWNKTQTAAVAIAKAASMTENIDVVISYRSIWYNRGASHNTIQPLMLMAYDSRKDKFSKIQTLFKHIMYCGTTPEGLCFEAVLKELTSTKNGTESYFINFSDGWPGFDNKEISYGGTYAVEHTAAQVKKIQQAGVQVLSYFISDGYYGSSNESFTKMYGKGAEFIDVNNVTQLAKTLNKKFEVKI